MKHIIGLDIGTSLVKAVKIDTVKDGKFVLTNLGVSEISSESIEEMEPAAKNNLIVQAIKRAFDNGQIKSKNAAISMVGESIIIRNVKLPYMSKEELKNVIKFEAEQYIPFNIDQVVLDFQILKEISEDNQKKLEVLLVAVKEEAVNEKLKLLQSCGLDISLIDSDVFCMQNCFELNYGIKQEETVALLNIGSIISSLNILEDGITRFTRDIPIGGNLLTKDIERTFKLGYIEAETLKKQQGSIIIESDEVELSRIPDKDDRTIKIFEAIVPTINKLLAEVRRSFDFYEAQAQKRSINKLLVSGGTSKLKNFVKYLSQKLKITVEYHNPLMNIEKNLHGYTEEQLNDLMPYLVIAVGLASRKVK